MTFSCGAVLVWNTRLVMWQPLCDWMKMRVPQHVFAWIFLLVRWTRCFVSAVRKKNEDQVPNRDLTNVIPWFATRMRRIKFMILTVCNVKAISVFSESYPIYLKFIFCMIAWFSFFYSNIMFHLRRCVRQQLCLCYRFCRDFCCVFSFFEIRLYSREYLVLRTGYLFFRFQHLLVELREHVVKIN
jgi:hypothetical protein